MLFKTQKVQSYNNETELKSRSGWQLVLSKALQDFSKMLAPCIQKFTISKSFGVGIANFGFWTADDDGYDDIFTDEETKIKELVLHTQV